MRYPRSTHQPIEGSTIWGVLMLTFFAIGYAVPLATGFTGMRWGRGKLSGAAGKIARVIPCFGGSFLVIMGFYFLLTI